MINLKNWSMNDWLFWADKSNTQLYIACDFAPTDKKIKIMGNNLFANYTKFEWDIDEIYIHDDTNTITIHKDNYTIECKNVFAYFKGVGYIYVCWEKYVRTKPDEFEVWLAAGEKWNY